MQEELRIIDGTYKKDDPHMDIGKQKFKVKRFHTVEVEYSVVANSKDEAESAVLEHGGIEKISFTDGYHGDEPVEMLYYDHNHDSEAESDYAKYRGPTTTKIEECVPYEEHDYDTEQDYLDYESPEWTTDEMRWNEVESDTPVTTKTEEVPF